MAFLSHIILVKNEDKTCLGGYVIFRIYLWLKLTKLIKVLTGTGLFSVVLNKLFQSNAQLN